MLNQQCNLSRYYVVFEFSRFRLILCDLMLTIISFTAFGVNGDLDRHECWLHARWLDYLNLILASLLWFGDSWKRWKPAGAEIVIVLFLKCQ